MNDLPTISVIVVSWQRHDDLRRCLMSLQQQDHPALELVVVADASGVDLASRILSATGGQARLIPNPGGNISVARNLGLMQAAGEVVGFIDDDAAAEPTWARRLAAAFHDPAVAAATGFTRGRNGISLQWRAAGVDATGHDHPLEVPDQGGIWNGRSGYAIKPVGTNCAFRRAMLLQAGGFDPAYRFYLDDADVGMRLAAYGATAVVPLAQVQHGFAASTRRRADRVPLDLTDIGASTMVFLRRHAVPDLWPTALARLRAEQRQRVLRHMVAGRILPGDVSRLLASLEAGITEATKRNLPRITPLQPEVLRFQPLAGIGPRPARLISGRIWQGHKLAAQARRALAEGELPTVIRLSPTSLRHHAGFTEGGWWEQRGGLFGASDRRDPPFRFWRFARRVAREAAHWAKLRPLVPDEPQDPDPNP
ncbi:glycosyltransferase family 2 protein [Gemmobacter denitrificans]|uniref:Glycosyltransferase family 2 protein n=1 Tax=Gemmobacter denitrificans TaxID=3123040 RepID=A0ABU8BZL7_9RHOB